MQPDVKVIDANTGLELFGVDELGSKNSTADEDKRLYYQNVYKHKLSKTLRRF